MSRNPVGWFEIYVNDIDKARAFYEAILGVTLSELKTPADDVALMWTFPMDGEAAGSSGAIVSMQGGEQPSGNGTIVYFTCEDCAIEESRVVPAGGKIVKEKFSIGDYGFISLVSDPDGNVIGLHSLK